jgi:hypothetical protein
MLSRENSDAKKAASETPLIREELRVCNAELTKATRSRRRCEKWADELDTEKGNKTVQLHEASLKLREEQQIAKEAAQKAAILAARFEETRKSLAEIEEQKNAALQRLQEEKKVLFPTPALCSARRLKSAYWSSRSAFILEIMPKGCKMMLNAQNTD